MAKGGTRRGAGRPKGAKSAKTLEIAERAFANGITPLEYLLSVMRDTEADQVKRIDAAKAAAPYVHPRLATTEITGKDGGPVKADVSLIVEFIKATPA